MYKLEQVQEATLKYFNGDELAADKWIQKYCLKDNKGNYLELTPDDMHHRLAKEFSRIENKYKNPLSEETIYNILRHFKYIIPQGSPMYGIGNNESTTSLSNCFVIGNNNSSDSYGSIMRTDEEQIQLMKRRGGVGHDMSHLRPAGALANNAILGDLAGLSLYMERYSNSTREVAQDGRSSDLSS
jgi:ribonucleoside-diphosphate reductase alpha chain